MTPPPIVAVALRADALRNRALVLDAAKRLFATLGLGVSMQDIADEAGVGVGTVFRRFATKDELVTAILLEGMEQLVELAEGAVERAAEQPWDAFAEYFLEATALHARHRGLMEAIGTAQVARPALDDVRERLGGAIRALVECAVAAGELRPDVAAEDVPMLQCAISRTTCKPMAVAEPESWRRAAMLLLDGMRASSASEPLRPTLPTFEQALAAIR